MADYVVSVDPGNGGTNAVLAKANGYKSIYFPSVRASATGDTLGLGADMELQYDYVDWYGHRYVVGEDVLRVTRRHMERHTGANRYGNELHQFLTAVALGKLGIDKGTVDLTLFAPPGMYLEANRLIKQRFNEHKGKVEIQFKGDKKPRTWRYETIRIWPEGVGAAACFILDDNGQLVSNDTLNGEVVVLDMGAYTLDALKFTDGSFNLESLEHATWESGGVTTHILEPILRQVKKQGDDFSLLSADDIDRVLRLGLVSEDFTLRTAGYEIDLQPLVEKYRERYAGWIANNIADGVFGGFRGIKSVILVGGGALLIEDFMREWYGDKILDRKKSPTARRIHPVDFNCVGGLRLALAQQKQGTPS
ncbi:MAG: ParM/StbA family protein [Anaerolineae bacterium]|nr:ParM/StbA family protein [Anaerolineae bacterium]